MTSRKNILVHDYAGHPFQVQLSRHLAHRGIADVTHAYCASTHTPQADLVRSDRDAACFNITPISLGAQIKKYSFVSRFMAERKYGKLLAEVCRKTRPDVVLSANTPTLAQYELARWCKKNGARLVTWVQDMYGIAAHRILRKKVPIIGEMIGKYFIRLDESIYRQSAAIVPITEDFSPLICKSGVAANRVVPIHNWAPIENFPLVDRDNDWARKNLPSEGTRFIYSGTLSIRHNPKLLLLLAQKLAERGDCHLLVVSEGEAVEWLKSQAAERNLESFTSLKFQPLEVLPQVMGAADVLISILEEDAGVFCVPSKVLTYLCAGRAVLSAMPPENLASRLIREHQFGLNVSPSDADSFVANGLRLAEDPELRTTFGKNARAYAEANFSIHQIADKFIKLFDL